MEYKELMGVRRWGKGESVTGGDEWQLRRVLTWERDGPTCSDSDSTGKTNGSGSEGNVIGLAQSVSPIG